MNNKVGIESDFMSRIFGFFKSFKLSKEPFKAIELAVRNFKNLISSGNVKNADIVEKISSHSKIINSLNIWNFANKLNNPIQKNYVESIDTTQGSYYKRNPRVYKSVIDMNLFINENYKNIGYTTVFDIYTRIFKILSDKELTKVFEMAFKISKKGNENGGLIYNDYISLIYVLEYLTLSLTEFVMKINDTYTFEIANKDYSAKHNTFISSACSNIVAIIEKYENTKEPSKLVYALVQNETEKTGSEEDKSLFLNTKISQEFLPLAAAIPVAMFVAKIGIGIIGFIASLMAVRYVYYSLSCLKVDLVKSLIEQSNLILMNISKLNNDLSKLKEGTPEYNKLKEIIDKQNKYLSIIVDICNKLGDEDIYNAKKIMDRESEDDETIDSTDERSSDITKFDI